MTLGTPFVRSMFIFVVLFSAVYCTAVAQSLVTTMTLGRDELGLVKTSQGISTKLSFPERIKEIICGDLYDPADGRGNFVIQRSDNDLFLKPVAATGVSNLFVKTGERGEYTYSFELLVVPVTQSFRIVNIANGHKNKNEGSKSGAMPPRTPTVDSIFEGEADASSLVLLGVGPRTSLEPPPEPSAGTLIPEPPKEANATDSTRRMSAARVELRSEAIRRAKPPYPDAAKQAGISGEVVVEVLVDERGRVKTATAISGHALLRPAAVTAAHGWRFRPFRPTKLDGVPVQAVGTITFVFKQTSSP